MTVTGLRARMSALEAAMASEPLTEGPDLIKAGVNLGTACTVPVALDGKVRPLAAACELADVVRDGVVFDFVGATEVLRRLKRDVESRLGALLTVAHGAYPPGVARSDVRAEQHVIEAADMECRGLVDEPTAAKAVLQVRDGVIVDVVAQASGLEAVVPVAPLFVTPLGIARLAPACEPAPGSTNPGMVPR